VNLRVLAKVVATENTYIVSVHLVKIINAKVLLINYLCEFSGFISIFFNIGAILDFP